MVGNEQPEELCGVLDVLHPGFLSWKKPMYEQCSYEMIRDVKNQNVNAHPYMTKPLATQSEEVNDCHVLTASRHRTVTRGDFLQDR